MFVDEIANYKNSLNRTLTKSLFKIHSMDSLCPFLAVPPLQRDWIFRRSASCYACKIRLVSLKNWL
jgi:hypothetical protein